MGVLGYSVGVCGCVNVSSENVWCTFPAPCVCVCVCVCVSACVFV